METKIIGAADSVDASDVFMMFHDYVIQEFGGQEKDLVEVAGQFSKDIGCPLNSFLGMSYKDYKQLPRFTKWFESRQDPQTTTGVAVSPKVRIKAKTGRATQISGEELVPTIKAKVQVDVQYTAGIQVQRPSTPAVPVVSRLELGEGLHFFGMFYPSVRREKDFFGNDRNYSEVRFIKVEREVEQRRVNIELGPSFSEYAGKGELVVGECLNGVPRLLDHSRRAIMFRSWSDFEEATQYNSLQAFLDSDQGLKLTPRFKTKYGEIVIFDECRFYAGFRMDMASRVMTASEIMVSAERFPDLAAVRAVVYLFENRDDFQYVYRNAADKFMIGSPFRKRWQSTDAFFADRSFWKEVDSQKVLTTKEILKVCAEVLQDGVWHDREDLLKELNERIPCLSASGISDSVIRDGLREYANVAFLEDQVGNWSVQLRQRAEKQVLVKGGRESNESGDVKPNVFCSEKEAAFLKSFIDDVLRCGYDYEPQDIVRFHTSVKSGGFTLLGGAPGSGKSTLASLYSKALGGGLANDQGDTRYLTVDVNPSWIDPNDVLGYWNLNVAYSCASSGLVPFLRKAAECKEVRLVCMEEMNLARVEHYFSNFIQLMSRKPEDRVLLGVPADESDKWKPDNARLLLPMNVRFVGTNNFDETTQRFSARFYDRCNYIELQQTEGFDKFPKQIPSESSGQFNYGVPYEEYEKWWLKDAQSTLLDSSVVDKFKEIVKKLRALNLQPSPRVKLAILEYILSRPFFEGCGSEYSSQADCQLIALDESIAQRVLPRYSINYLRDDAAARKELREELKDMPLSSSIFESKCSVGERPSRV